MVGQSIVAGANNLTAELALDYDLVMVSSTVSSGQVNTKFEDSGGASYCLGKFLSLADMGMVAKPDSANYGGHRAAMR